MKKGVLVFLLVLTVTVAVLSILFSSRVYAEASCEGSDGNPDQSICDNLREQLNDPCIEKISCIPTGSCCLNEDCTETEPCIFECFEEYAELGTPCFDSPFSEEGSCQTENLVCDGYGICNFPVYNPPETDCSLEGMEKYPNVSPVCNDFKCEIAGERGWPFPTGCTFSIAKGNGMACPNGNEDCPIEHMCRDGCCEYNSCNERVEEAYPPDENPDVKAVVASSPEEAIRCAQGGKILDDFGLTGGPLTCPVLASPPEKSLFSFLNKFFSKFRKEKVLMSEENGDSEKENICYAIIPKEENSPPEICGGPVIRISKKYIERVIDPLYAYDYNEPVQVGNDKYILVGPYEPVECYAYVSDPDIDQGKVNKENISAEFKLFYIDSNGAEQNIKKETAGCGELRSDGKHHVLCNFTFKYPNMGWSRLKNLYCKIQPTDGKDKGERKESNKDLLIIKYTYYFLQITGGFSLWRMESQWAYYLDLSKVNKMKQTAGKPIFLKNLYTPQKRVVSGFLCEDEKNKLKFYLAYTSKLDISLSLGKDILILASMPNTRFAARTDHWTGWCIEVNGLQEKVQTLAHELGHAHDIRICDEYDYKLVNLVDAFTPGGCKNKYPDGCKVNEAIYDLGWDKFINWLAINYPAFEQGSGPPPSPTAVRAYLNQEPKPPELYLGHVGRKGCRQATPYENDSSPDSKGEKIPDYIAYTHMIIPLKYPEYSIMGLQYLPAFGVPYPKLIYPKGADCPLRECEINPQLSPSMKISSAKGVSLNPELENDSVLKIGIQLNLTDYFLEDITISDGEFSFNISNLTVNNYNVELIWLNKIDNADANSYNFSSVADANSLNVSITNSSGGILENYYINPHFYTIWDPVLTSVFEDFWLLFHSDAKYLKVYFKGEEKLSVDLEEALCNQDNVCNGFENYFSCSDCTPEDDDDVCASNSEDDVCDPDCMFDSDCAVFCSDGLKNGNEDNVDCGGACVPCVREVNKDYYLKMAELWIKEKGVYFDDLMYSQII